MASKCVWKQILNFIPVFFLGVSLDICYIWPSPMMYRLQNELLPMTSANNSLMGSMAFYGKIFGPFIAFLLMDRIGRKRLMLTCSTVITLQWTILCFYKTVPAILVSRFIIGIIHAISMPLIPVYIAENCYPSIRGNLVAFYSGCYAVGHSIAYALIFHLEFHQLHRILFIISFVTTLSLFYTVESVEFLASKKLYKEAERNFFRLRSVESTIDRDYFGKIVKHTKPTTSNPVHSIKSFFHSKASIKAFKIMAIIQVMIYIGTGSGPLNAYTTVLISDGLNVNVVTTISYVKTFFYLVGAIFASIFSGKISRKVSSMCGFNLAILVMLSCTFLYGFHNLRGPIPNFSYHIFICLSVLDFTKAAFLNPWMLCIRGELLPQHTKSVILAFSISLASLAMAVHTHIFLMISQIGGLALNFAIISIALIFTLVYTYRSIPETKDKTLIEIENELNEVHEKAVELRPIRIDK